jgi:leader peptidase (prepilin peptidase)/N-methyltransferase
MSEVFIFIFGAMIGSFLNVCIYRMPLDLSIMKPARSFCPSCKQQIPWYLNIPLFSYLMLKGKCRFCSARIPLRYFWVELLTATAFLYLWFLSGGDPVLFGIRAIFVSMLIVIIATDFEHKFIPDLITFPGMIFGLVFSLVPGVLFHQDLWYHRLAQSALGLVGGYGILLVTALIGNWLFRKESMGGGDLKLMAMMGAFIGMQKVFYVFMLAPFIALPFAFWYKAVKKEEEFPFGPFLAFWGAAFFLYGDFFTDFLNRIYGF